MTTRFLSAALATALLASIAGASAQTATTTTTTSTTISPAEETKIREYVVKEKRTSVTAPSGFTVSTGAVVPESVELYSFPSDVGVTNYRYSVIGGQTVLVDPGTRKVVRVLQ